MDSETILGLGLGGLLTTLLQDSERPQIRVTGFSHPEIACALEYAGLDRAGSSKAMVLVSGSPAGGLENLLEPFSFTANGRTATYGRNHNEHGLVYFQTNRESDSQSTKAMYHLRDSEFFSDGRWQFLTSAIGPTPEIGIPESLGRVLDEFVRCHQQIRRLQLRPFGRFLARIHEGWSEGGVSELTLEESAQLVNAALPELGLFRCSALVDPLKSQKTSRIQSLLRKLIYSSNLQRSNGGELDRDKILSRLEQVELGGSTVDEIERRREIATDFVEGRSDWALQILDFGDFSEALSSRSRQRSQELGTDIRQFLLAREEVGLVEGFDDLDLEDRLNDREAAAAEAFMAEAMFHLLDKHLQKQVRRLRPRRASFTDPLTGLVETFESILEDVSDLESVTIELGTGAEDSPALRSLFAFLHGPLLKSLKERLDGRVALRLDPILDSKPWLEHTVPDAVDEEETTQDELSQLAISLSADPGDRVTFLWKPEDARIWWLWVRAICHEDFRNDPTARILVSAIEDAEPGSLGQRVQSLAEVPKSWTYDRKRLLGEIAESGLSAPLVEELVQQWSLSLETIIDSVEDGTLEPLLGLLSGDCVHVRASGEDSGHHQDASQIWMLGSHPLRLRWLVAWRDRIGDFLEGQLTGSLKLSPENPAYFRRRMERWSAHRYPPVISPKEGSVYIPAEERGGCECYVPLDGNERDVSDVVDATAVRALVEVAQEYLKTHPYKRDGLHILFQLTGDGEVAREFVRQFVRKEQDVRLTLHLLVGAEASQNDRIIDSYGTRELLHTSVHSNFPLVEIRQHQLDSDLAEIFGDKRVVDVAVFPFLFSGALDVTLQMSDHVISHKEAHPVEIRPQTPVHSAQRLLIDLVPNSPDRPLRLWAEAVAIAHNRGRPGDSRGSYLRLNSDIAGATQRHLASLLEIARQVVSLDVGISRAQLLGLNNRPEISHVVPGLGKNGDYSLVVASNEVYQPLAFRLGELLEKHFGAARALEFESMIGRIIEDTDRTGAMMAIKGAARSAFAVEVLGRSAARIWCDRHRAGRGNRVFWLALDDYDEWFDGGHADLLRVSLYMELGKRKLDLLVCESKFTVEARAPVAARDEVARTVALLSDVLGPRSADRIDRGTWLSAFADAIQNSPDGDTVLDERERHDLLEGNFVLANACGMGLVWDMSQDEQRLQHVASDRLSIVSLNAEELWSVLSV